MKNILFAAALVVILALTACSSDNQSANNEEKDDSSQSEATQNEEKDTGTNKQDTEEKNKNDKGKDTEKAPAKYSVFIEDTTFTFEKKEIKIPFKVAKNGEPLTDGKLGLLVKVPIGDLPAQVEEVKNGKYNGKVRVPEPGVYDAKVFKMEGKRRNILGGFKLKFEK